ncbi:putative PHD type zinc finger protein with BAH domain-containing protein [Polyrhizophydium stewartii]|uniref:PHD type zinc finger protein with BAH domain-containing protein n=1 Tax=Polyrhizophydium stewartii TaxID=2732419 RepID=A0ABR4N832_9FUNG
MSPQQNGGTGPVMAWSMAAETNSQAGPSSMVIRGTRFRVNDIVFLKPETSLESLYVARILCFITETSSPDAEPKIKVAWFLRPRDVFVSGRRKHYDPNLVVATMNTDENPISAIVRKCEVRHTSDIDDLDSFRKRPDAFFYNQLFDRYTRRLFDVVPLKDAKNLPEMIMRMLRNYQFILVEAGQAQSFTERRVCSRCSEWCSPDDEIAKCDQCSGIFHLPCAELRRAPAKGYTWVCVECLKASGRFRARKKTKGAEDDDEDGDGDGDGDGNTGSPPASEGGPRVRRGRFDQAGLDEEATNPVLDIEPAFPFRYYGEWASLDDLTNPDDKGHPKSSSRLGKAYQAEMPQWEGEGPDPESQVPRNETETRGGRRRRLKYSDYFGNENMVDRYTSDEVVFDGPALADAGIDASQVIDQLRSDMSTDKLSDYALDACLLALHKNHDSIEAIKAQTSNLSDELRRLTWSAEEELAFDTGFIKHGHELDKIQREFVPSRTLKEVVMHFYIWRKTERCSRVLEQYCKVYHKRRRHARLDASKLESAGTQGQYSSDSDLTDDEDETMLSGAEDGGEIECANCCRSVRETRPACIMFGRQQRARWCVACYDYYAAYSTAKIVSETAKRHNREMGRKRRSQDPDDEPAAKESRKRRVMSKTYKRKHTDGGEDADDPHDNGGGDVDHVGEGRAPRRQMTRPKCAACLEMVTWRSNSIARCSICTMMVHRQCYGVQPTGKRGRPVFQCDPCLNTKSRECSLLYDCVLCGVNLPRRDSPLKRTICGNWVHVQCAVWHPEPRFSNTELLDIVECIGLIDASRWHKVCSVCGTTTGACVQCNSPGCEATTHVTCAQANPGWRLAIARADPTAELSALAFCPAHAHAAPQPTCDRASGDEPSAAAGQMREYIAKFKAADPRFTTRGQKRAALQRLQGQCQCHQTAGGHGHGLDLEHDVAAAQAPAVQRVQVDVDAVLVPAH